MRRRPASIARPARALRRVLAVALAVALAASPAAAAERASLPEIERQVMCPICGTVLELSNAPQAERQRELIRRLIDRGLSEEEIKDELVAEYGPGVLAVPEASGFDLMAWVVPIVAGLLALTAIGLLVARRRGAAAEAPEPLGSEERRRLDRDISSYDM